MLLIKDDGATTQLDHSLCSPWCYCRPLICLCGSWDVCFAALGFAHGSTVSRPGQEAWGDGNLSWTWHQPWAAGDDDDVFSCFSVRNSNSRNDDFGKW